MFSSICYTVIGGFFSVAAAGLSCCLRHSQGLKNVFFTKKINSVGFLGFSGFFAVFFISMCSVKTWLESEN